MPGSVRWVIAALAAIALVWVPSVARAGVSSSTLHACVDARTGTMHLVSAGRRCARRQRSVSFAARGPAGRAGARGPMGPAGAAADVSALRAQVASLQSDVGSLKAANTSLTARLATVQGQVGSLSTLLAGVSRSNNLLTFSGMNVEINSGAGATDATVNGLGNLFIGYDEHPGTQSGSHNLVLGQYQSFSSYGGLLAGEQNTLTGAYASVTGGLQNTAAGTYAAILGGASNSASSFGAVSGGIGNAASGSYSAILGGSGNHATQTFSTVAGGAANTASGLYSAVSGGDTNTASGAESSVSGGHNVTQPVQYGHS